MATQDSETKDISQRLLNNELDALPTYLALKELCNLLEHNSGHVHSDTISALNKNLKRNYLAAQRLQYLIYREVSRIIALIIINAQDRSLAVQLISILNNIVILSAGSQRRGVAEVLGSLPINIDGPEIMDSHDLDIPTVRWNDVLAGNGLCPESVWEVAGRSIIFPIDDEGLLVIKLSSDIDSIQFMKIDALWMNYLGSQSEIFEKRFNIPEPLNAENDYIFYLEDLPSAICEQMEVKSDRYCAFTYKAHRDYFVYPNDHRENRNLNPEDFKEVMSRNAWLLGRLASAGIIHTAPIPLFHNRVQRNRRPDGGLYEWHKGGRLDRWLHSTRYPNFGLSGIRDFEHLVSYSSGGLKLYKKIGSHILGLILVFGSYFRNQDPDRLGRDEKEVPVDARDLFDKSLLTELVQRCFSNYYAGFSGVDFTGEMPADFNSFIFRMIQEMGVDRDMDEMVRITDQNAMTERGFKVFLTDNHFSDEEIIRLKRGAEDLAIVTGPHLGQFGREISLPELIEFLEFASATCVLGKYLHENDLGISGNEL